jgi:hypothetical protein
LSLHSDPRFVSDYNEQRRTQHTITLHTNDGEKFDYDSLGIFTLVEENGELKVADLKDFSDPEKRGKIHAWAAKTLAKRAT